MAFNDGNAYVGNVKCAEIVASRRKAGRPIGAFDAQIAAIAHVAGATVATRNIRDFESCGIAVIDPWAG